MLRHGDAVSLVHPDMVRSEVARGELAILRFDAPAVAFRTGIVWLTGRTLSAACRAYVRELLIEVGLDPDSVDLGCDNG
jgi:DNA-binding transcriptional LysR family regulator